MAAALLAPAVAPAQQADSGRLLQLEKALEKERKEQKQLTAKSKALTAEIEKLRKEMVEAARKAQSYEEDLSRLENKLADLHEVERSKMRELERRQAQMANVLAALQSMARRPPEAILAQPGTPADAVRSAILLRSAVPAIENSASELKAELEILRELRADIGNQRLKISAVSGQLDNQNEKIETLIARKAGLQKQTEARNKQAESRLKQMAGEAQNLRELMTKLEEEARRRLAEAQARDEAAEEARRKAAEEPQSQVAVAAPPPKPAPAPNLQPSTAAIRSFGAARGNLPYPARGSIVVRYGERSVAGSTQRGITIETRGGAQVIAPYDGLVVFAGPFRGYGQLLIIEHSDGYHSLLAGMDRIDGTVGQRLIAGEPVGVMGQGGNKPQLYMELRHNGQPVNPLPWLTASKGKVSG